MNPDTPRSVSRDETSATFETCSADQTAGLGARLAPLLSPGDVLPLWGEFGSGKTTFVRGVGRGLGVRQPVLSPSFTLLNVYRSRDGEPIYHVDLYRIGSLEEAEGLGIEDALDDDGPVLIEWPSVVAELLPEDRLDVTFETTDDDRRRVRFEARGECSRRLLSRFLREVDGD